MLDLKLVREKAEEVEKALARRNGGFSVKELLEVDAEFRKAQGEWERLRQRANEISELFKTGKVPKEQVEAPPGDKGSEEANRGERALERGARGAPHGPAHVYPQR